MTRGRALFVTPRGIGLAAGGIGLTALGVGAASTTFVIIGAAMLGAVVVAATWVAVSLAAARRGLSAVDRTVTPATLAVGTGGDVTMTVRVHRAVARTLALREQAVNELTGDAPVRATVARSRDAITLRYRLAPTRRGRWVLGPAIARTTDPFGLAELELEIGGTHQVAVWPAVEDLSASAGGLLGASDRAHAGARNPAADDASLRDYRDGDDLRRIHWRSSARRGELLVRSEEQQGRTEATVLLELPPGSAALEWSVSAAASIALSALDAGHPVRLVAGGTVTTAEGSIARAAETARAGLLDATVDLSSAPSAADAMRELGVGAAQLDPTPGTVIIAVVGPVDRASLELLAPHGEGGRAWALVRVQDRDRARGERTVTMLRAAGWRATMTEAPEPLAAAWDRLLAEASA